MFSTASVAKKITLTLLALLAVLALVASAVLIIQKNDSASAVKASDFNPGRIIDDAVFYNAGAMTASQIQTFLNAKNPYCDTNGTGRATDWGRPDITRATLASYIRNGTHGYNKNTNFHAPPYSCLKDFKQDTPQVAAASGLCEAIPARSNRTAAQIIHDVAQACGINPQVFLVLLEKEQSLVTDIWPLNLQYQRATGFACPDNVGGVCDPDFNGFFRQVYAAGRQFKLYQSRPNDYNYRAGVTNNIFWQTNGGNFVSDGRAASRRNGQCGYSRVRIENQATAALYIYTPYRPNQAAMANFPGTGDACSAYGNRNFWFMFNDWFGSTQAPNYGYSAYRVKGAGMSSGTAEVGKTETMSVQFINTGTRAWYDTESAPKHNERPVVLLALDSDRKTHTPFNSAFSTSTRATEKFSKILTQSGSVKSGESIVLPGETAVFNFDILAPENTSVSETHEIAYQPVIPAGDGNARINVTDFSTFYLNLTESTPPAETFRDTSNIPITEKPYNGYRIKGSGMSSTTMRIGETKQVSVYVKNTGTQSWHDSSSSGSSHRELVLHALHPSRSKPSGFRRMFSTETRATESISAVYLPNGEYKNGSVVEPGEVARFDFTIDAPSTLPPGSNYRIYYNPVFPAFTGHSRIEMLPNGDTFYITLGR